MATCSGDQLARRNRCRNGHTRRCTPTSRYEMLRVIASSAQSPTLLGGAVTVPGARIFPEPHAGLTEQIAAFLHPGSMSTALQRAL